MIRKLRYACLIILTSKLSYGQEQQKIASKIKRVTVFLSGAQITRTATVNIVPGNSSLVFEGLSPNVDPQSIQVKASGDFTILNVKSQLDFLSQKTNEQTKDLLAQQKTLTQKIQSQNDLFNIAKQEEDMLLKNQVVNGANTNLDVLKLKQALDFQTTRLTELKKREQLISDGLTALNSEFEKYQKQYRELRDANKPTGDIMVNISAKSASSTQFTLSYVVNAASWFPTYDIRAKDINSPLTLAYKANVSQKTGENWNNVQLTLSTGDPSASGTKPTLNPYYINFGTDYINPANNITKVTGRVTGSDDGRPIPGVSIRIDGTTIGTTTDPSGNYSISLPSPNVTLKYTYIGYETVEKKVYNSVINVSMPASSQSLQEVRITGFQPEYKRDISTSENFVRIDAKRLTNTVPLGVDQIETQTNVEFSIENPCTIPDDGKQAIVEINTLEIPALFEYYCAPKITPDVFLTAKIADWNQYNLLSGEANLFFEGTFIGKSVIDTHNAADTLNLSMGTDKNIVVKKDLDKNYVGKQGLFGGKKRDTRVWIITVKNRKTQNINLLLEDQVPVSQNSAIEVETQDVSGGNLNTTTGKVSWLLKLAPQQEKKLNLKYQVSYPKDQQVFVH